MSALLLDTHVVLWWLITPRKLSRRAFRLIERGNAWISVLSIWEARLKQERRGLTLPQGDLVELISAQGIRILPLTIEHVQSAANLRGLHADPYDRLIVGVARAEKMVFLTRDAELLERAAPLLGDLLMEA